VGGWERHFKVAGNVHGSGECENGRVSSKKQLSSSVDVSWPTNSDPATIIQFIY
jgi:hypothetical protein